MPYRQDWRSVECSDEIDLELNRCRAAAQFKSGAQVEFGNTLFLAEQNNGIILDWTLYQTDVKEVQATKESVNKMTKNLNTKLPPRPAIGDAPVKSQ